MAVLGMTFAKTIMTETVMERLSILVAAKGRAVISVRSVVNDFLEDSQH
jgi:hypothetical protein